MIPEIDFDRLATLGPRTVAVLPLDGAQGEAQRVAVDLSAAIVDALSGARGVKIVGASTVRAAISTRSNTVDPAAVGRVVHADLVVGGDVRLMKESARVHVRLVDVACSVQVWAERIDGSLADPFDLEDRVVAEVGTAVRARTGDVGGVAGPTEPKVRTLWEKARAAYSKFGPTFVEEAVTLLREAQSIAPNDPWVLSALGAALTRKWLLNAAMARELIAEAEEITLRALAIDPTIGDTYNTIGIMRLQHGETRAAVRAFREAIARTPLHAEAHSYLGRLLGESGYVEEAMRRFDLAIRLDSMALVSHFEKGRTLALLGDRAAASASIERAIALGGAMTGIVSQARFVMWFVDRPLAARLVENVENAGLRSHFGGSRILPMLEAFAQNRPMGEIVDLFEKFVDMSTASPRQRSFFYQLATEFAAASNSVEEAFASLEKSAALPLIDLLWMDKCPVLACMRDDPRFMRIRAIVAARVAEIWA
jgi:serine/threonine-protein kinase